ncbi:MAG: carnitine dehydratase [Crocinitomicaceae bacterium]|nr:carnitine dehydratase [Crocinitomicaceae bacterium]
MGPLESVRVLELASVLAGPLAGTALAERGARVTKVERPPSGDVTRSWKMAKENASDRSSAYYESANGDKEVVWKDLASDSGQAWLEEALASHDVLIENFKQADLTKFNLEPKAVAARHPHLIRVRLVGFNDAPERLAYDVVVQAETGFMGMNGFDDRPPVRMPVALMDVLASHQIRMATMEGLLAKADGRKGFFAEVSLEGSGISALVNQATNQLVNGQTPRRNGGQHPNIAPYGDVLNCVNGHVVLAVGNDRQFEGLCRVLKVPKLAMDERYRSNQLRVINREELVSELNEAAQEWSKTALEKALRDAGTPAGVVRTMDEVFEDSSHPWTVKNLSGATRPRAVAYHVNYLL